MVRRRKRKVKERREEKIKAIRTEKEARTYIRKFRKKK